VSGVYQRAERRYFDPYEFGMRVARVVARIAWGVDRSVDWIYDGLAVKVATGLSRAVRFCHDGAYTTYLVWAIVGVVVMVLYVMV
jgi:hypothetical protein